MAGPVYYRAAVAESFSIHIYEINKTTNWLTKKKRRCLQIVEGSARWNKKYFALVNSFQLVLIAAGMVALLIF